MAIITGPSDSVPVFAEVRYAEVVLDAGTSVGSTAAISYAPVEAQWVAAKNTQTPIYPTHSPKNRFTQILERRQNFTHPPKA